MYEPEKAVFNASPHVAFSPVHMCLPIEWDDDEREDADIETERLGEGAKLAHELGQIPPLEECGVELEGDAEDGDDHVGHGQVGDVQVGHALHRAGEGDDEDDQEVAADGQQGDHPVAEEQKGHNH